MKGSGKVTKWDLFLTTLRTFYLQGSWNYERMQALGFCFSLIPAAKRLTRSREELVSFLKRHLVFFNTNPVMASYIIGATVRLEEESLSGKSLADEDVFRFKNSISSLLGSVGDELFWGTLRPFSALLGVLLVLGGHVLLGIIVLLASYNIPHIYFRVKGIFSGYGSGFALTLRKEKLSPALLSNWFGVLGAFLSGYYSSALFFDSAEGGYGGGLLFLIGTAVSLYLLKKRILGSTGVALALVVSSLFAAIVFEILHDREVLRSVGTVFSQCSGGQSFLSSELFPSGHV